MEIIQLVISVNIKKIIFRIEPILSSGLKVSAKIMKEILVYKILVKPKLCRKIMMIID